MAREFFMLLTTRHVQILKDIDRFSGIQRYHGLLPEKHALLYDDHMLSYLQDQNLVEEGTVIARCGRMMRGYRLTENAREDLDSMGVELRMEPEGESAEFPEFIDDELGTEHIRALRDLYHMTQIRKFNGIAPKHEVEDYDKAVIKLLYDFGYIIYIKVKGKSVKYTKGYILTDDGIKLLKRMRCLA